MSNEKRSYRKGRRAELEEQTRQRITESAVELHGTVGPANTSISAIAEHAGVRRATVYRHFPNELTLFAACSGHWFEQHPVPDIGAWGEIADIGKRRKTALSQLYGFYREGAAMLEKVLRDEDLIPALKTVLEGYHGFIEAAAGMLVSPDEAQAGRERASVGHALAFSTWRSLAIKQGLDDATSAGLMCDLVALAGR